jgi:secreted trypsin-like serine protease
LITLASLGGWAARAHADIVGGDDVSGQDPIAHSTVALYQQTRTGGMLCSATLISKEYAVTAAHCVENGIDHMVVVFGKDIRSDVRGAVRVTHAEVARAWQEKHMDDEDLGDIAVIHLEGKLPRGFHRALLLPKKIKLQKGDSVILAGYGISNSKRGDGEGTLRRATVTVENPSLGKTEIVLDQRKGSGACHGDSGGPAFVERDGKLYLMGVTSRGYPMGAPDDCKHEVVYTQVNAYRKWISQEIRANSKR